MGQIPKLILESVNKFPPFKRGPACSRFFLSPYFPGSQKRRQFCLFFGCVESIPAEISQSSYW